MKLKHILKTDLIFWYLMFVSYGIFQYLFRNLALMPRKYNSTKIRLDVIGLVFSSSKTRKS